METPIYWRIYVLAPAPAAHWAASEPPPDLRVQGLRPFKFMDVERKYVRNHLIEINQMLTHFQSCENQSYFIFNQTVTFQIQDLLESLHSDDKPQTEKRKKTSKEFLPRHAAWGHSSPLPTWACNHQGVNVGAKFVGYAPVMLVVLVLSICFRIYRGERGCLGQTPRVVGKRIPSNDKDFTI